MTQNVLIFNNQTVTPVQFILYLREPAPAVSVVWQQMFAAPKVPSPLTWTEDWAAVFASFEDEIFTPIEMKPTSAGRRWRIRTYDGAQELVESGPAPAGYVAIDNDSGVATNPGVGLSGGGAVYMTNALSGTRVELKVGSLGYWLGLPSLPVQNGQRVDEESFLIPPAQISSPLAVTVTLTGPPLMLAFSHTMGDPAALFRGVRLLR